MTKRELNKKLNSKTLKIRNAAGIKDGIIRVIRAREIKENPNQYDLPYFTEVDIQIYAQVMNTDGEYETLDSYGPKAIRNFLRRTDSKVDHTVSNWLKLWGLHSSIKINNMKLMPKKW